MIRAITLLALFTATVQAQGMVPIDWDGSKSQSFTQPSEDQRVGPSRFHPLSEEFNQEMIAQGWTAQIHPETGKRYWSKDAGPTLQISHQQVGGT